MHESDDEGDDGNDDVGDNGDGDGVDADGGTCKSVMWYCCIHQSGDEGGDGDDGCAIIKLDGIGGSAVICFIVCWFEAAMGGSYYKSCGPYKPPSGVVRTHPPNWLFWGRIYALHSHKCQLALESGTTMVIAILSLFSAL